MGPVESSLLHDRGCPVVRRRTRLGRWRTGGPQISVLTCEIRALRSFDSPLRGSLRTFDVRMARHERAWRLAEGEAPGESNGAKGGIRTPTFLRTPAPQAGASASSATF